MIKLVFIDLDGTLLNRNKNITPLTARTIDSILSKGMRVVLTSARPPRDTLKYYRELKLDTPMINYNGGLVHCYNTGIRFCHHTIEPSVFGWIYTEMGHSIENFLLEIEDEFYVGNIDAQVREWIDSGGTDPKATGDVIQLINAPISKILLKTSDVVNRTLEQAYKGHLIQTISDRTNGWSEWLHPNATKALAMIRIAEMYGIKLSEVMSIGDELNDKSMIEMAGIGVAMENGHEEVKQVADYITASNEDDGVARAIIELIE